MNRSMPLFTLGAAMAALIEARRRLEPRAVFVATMSAQFALDALGETSRRIDSVPLMGGAAGLGLGISMARPDVPVVVVDGDSSLLMELGSLATVTRQAPRRYVHIVVNNGVQFNGITNLPAVSGDSGAGSGVDFAGLARAAGYAKVQAIASLAAWNEALPGLLEHRGTAFVDLRVQPDARVFGPQRAQPVLPDLQFVRMHRGVRLLKAELAAQPVA